MFCLLVCWFVFVVLQVFISGLTLVPRVSLSPNFNQTIYSYALEVKSTVTMANFSLVASDPFAPLYLNNSVLGVGSVASFVRLNVGPNLLIFMVTSQDGISSRSYRVVITREPIRKILMCLCLCLF
jgi:hypothetical protein